MVKKSTTIASTRKHHLKTIQMMDSFSTTVQSVTPSQCIPLAEEDAQAARAATQPATTASITETTWRESPCKLQEFHKEWTRIKQTISVEEEAEEILSRSSLVHSKTAHCMAKKILETMI